MPVSRTSRYHNLPTYEATDEKGNSHANIGIRLDGAATPDPNIFQHILTGLETIEYLAWRYYDSSEMWWRIADAGPPVFPLDLPTGYPVSVPSRDAVGRVQRTRRF